MFWEKKSIIEEGDVAIIWLTREQVYPIIIERGKVFNNKFGSYAHSDMIGLPYGSQVPSSNGIGYLHILRPTPELWTRALPHRTQIVYTHDISYIQSKLRIQTGMTVLEAGTGSGNMTHALARAVGKTGRVFSYEYHAKRYEDALNEFKQNRILAPEGPVILSCQDVIIDGFDIKEKEVIVHAAFFDLPAPWKVIYKLIPHFSKERQSRICCFNPCIEQVQKTLKHLREFGFYDIQLSEVSCCEWIARKTELKDISEAADRIREIQTSRKNKKRLNNENFQHSKRVKEGEEGRNWRDVGRMEKNIRSHTSYLTFATWLPLPENHQTQTNKHERSDYIEDSAFPILSNMSSVEDLVKQAQICSETKEYQRTIELLTEALHKVPISIDYYIKRSTAYNYNKQYNEALKDAEAAVYLSYIKRENEKKGLAQMNRGIALFHLGQIADSFYAFKKAKEAIPSDTTLDSWFLKAKTELEKTQERKENTIKEIPELSELEPSLQTKIEKIECITLDYTNKNKPNIPTELLQENMKSLEPIIRHEWYQTDQTVIIILYVKSVNKDTCKAEFRKKSLSVSFLLPATQENYTFELSELFNEIDVSLSIVTVFSSKIELHLRKRFLGKWLALETKISNTQAFNNKDSTKINIYPSSSKHGSKDWDLIAKNMATDTQETGDAALNKLFQEIYANADDDTKRAMMKSYIESSGTALSTNWKEVGAKKVPIQPPAGMEAKPWYN
ncbi:hypothetical protein PMAC_002693 [Pneumocystis sp. 'macacae']|nr:hypothetical protein PMAC_002693 [Pneumocystis sp. 'macacae']